ncbi:UDP-N-acetylmuramate--L-alanine ligase [Patescibacteria group bacterium]|nr:MAG: UDP-N-acetylmuramate--L-alanine ligase [Patescibacteria group bacterium]
MSSDTFQFKKVYCIGIKGAGMTAIAEMLQQRGATVSGSDTAEHFYTDEILNQRGIHCAEGFAVENLPLDAEVVIHSTVYTPENNVELKLAVDRGLKLFSYPEVLGMLFREKLGVAVCGTHGKTTTTALLATCLSAAGAEPSAIVGSRVLDWQGSALVGQGQHFVIEADEYQNKLRFYDPFAVVLTSVDWDHPDFFPTVEVYRQVFRDFVARIPRHGFLVVWGDSTDTLDVAKSARCEVISYGFHPDNDVVISNFNLPVASQSTSESSRSNFQTFQIAFKGEDLGQFKTQLIGQHNALNAAASIAVCHKLKLDLDQVRRGMEKFGGTKRRFEFVGEKNGAILIDDYAHHPEEIKATLKGAREIYPGKKLTVIFHPHTFTRTKALLGEFAQSFDDADQVLILDIYGSAREQQGGVSSSELVDLVNRYNHGRAEYLVGITEAVEYLRDRIGPEDMVISMGAGNVWEVTKQLAAK